MLSEASKTNYIKIVIVNHLEVEPLRIFKQSSRALIIKQMKVKIKIITISVQLVVEGWI